MGLFTVLAWGKLFRGYGGWGREEGTPRRQSARESLLAG